MKKWFLFVFFIFILSSFLPVESIYQKERAVTYRILSPEGEVRSILRIADRIYVTDEELAKILREAGIEFDDQDLIDYSGVEEIPLLVEYESIVTFGIKDGEYIDGKMAVRDVSSYPKNIRTVDEIKRVTSSMGGMFKRKFKTSPVSALTVPRNRIKDFKSSLSSSLGNKLKRISIDSMGWVTLDDSVPLVGAPEVWGLCCDLEGNKFTGKGIKIAIIDTGVNYTHPDLIENIWVNENEIPDNGIDDDGNGFVDDYRGIDFTNSPPGNSYWHPDKYWYDDDPMDDNGHGTHVAAIAAGNGTLKGVAPDAKLLVYKALDSDGKWIESDVIAAIESAMDPSGEGNYDDPVDVISLSIGRVNKPPGGNLDYVINIASNLGVVVVVSAGNGGPDSQTITYPGNAKRAITVGAIYKKDHVGVYDDEINPKTGQIASFSSRGPIVWGEITSDKPDIVAPGVLVCSARTSIFEPWNSDPDNQKCMDDEHVLLSGTSMATPHVGGAAALLLQAHPEWEPNTSGDMIKSVLMNTSVDLGYDLYTQGSGLIDVLHAIEVDPNYPYYPNLTTAGDLRGEVNITGSLISNDFNNYTIEYRHATDQNWIQIMYSDVFTAGNLLFENWDTSLLSDGTYFLRLTEGFTGGQITYDTSLIRIDNIYISSPESEDVVSKSVEVRGTVTGAYFDSYDLTYATKDDPNTWLLDGITLVGGKIIDGTLGTWNISSLDYGLYFLKLTVYNTDGHISEDKIIVRVDNELHEGWPVSVGETRGAFTPTLADLDGDGYLEIIIRGSHSVFAYHHNGTLFWKREMIDYTEGTGPLPGVSVGDIDNDGEPEVVTGWSDLGSPHYCAYAWEADGTPVAGWPIDCGIHNYGTFFSSAVLEDLDGDGYLEIIMAGSGGPSNKTFVWNHDGSNYTGWPQEIPLPSGDTFIEGSPAVGDIDNDGDIEIVVHYIDYPTGYLYAWSSTGVKEDEFPVSLSNEAKGSSPVLVDLDRDCGLEIGIGSSYSISGQSKFIHHDGTPVSGWLFELPNRELDYSSMAIGNVHSDEGVEVIFGDYDGRYAESYVYVLNKSGQEKWRQKVEGWATVQPVIGDIDGDNKPDIITTSYNKKIYAWSGEGIPLSPFPKHLSAESQSGAAIGDIDNDGKVEIVAAAEDGKIFVWDLEGSYNRSNIEWPMFRNDETHTGLYEYPVCEGDINNDGIVDIVDVVIIALAFGSKPEDPNWNLCADVRPEWGLIDIVDIVYVAIHFGETCPGATATTTTSTMSTPPP